MNSLIKAALELLGDHPTEANLAPFKAQKVMRLRDAVIVQVAHLIRGTRRLFTSPHQYKLQKGIETFRYATIGFNLSPHKEAIRFTGVNMCSHASLGCIGSCLKLSGHNALDAATIARIARTILWIHAPTTFLHWAGVEIARYIRWSHKKGYRLAIRPNLLSDDTALAGAIKAIVGDSVPVYDYTAIPGAMRARDGVHRTFSRKEDNNASSMLLLHRGHPVAVVFAGPLPATWEGFPVIDGDEHDLRFKDAIGSVVVGLKVKGLKTATRERAIASGFAIAA